VEHGGNARRRREYLWKKPGNFVVIGHWVLMEENIIRLLNSASSPLHPGEILRSLNLGRHELRELKQMLRRLEKAGRITRLKGNRYVPVKEDELIPGRIRMNKAGKGFFRPDDPEMKEMVVPEHATSNAMHEDRVLVKAKDRRHRNEERDQDQRPQSASVVQILERRRQTFVGTFQRRGHSLTVTPDDPRMPGSVHVHEPRDVGRPARDGDKVVVELHEWESAGTPPRGEVIEVLGAPDEEGVDMLSVLRHHDLPLSFPEDVLAEANAIAQAHPNGEPTAEEVQGRVDCRNHNVITIDPDDAKDFDDAICIVPLDQERVRVWVHIADVSHYVRPGTKLDEEAKKRGNSTYLVDRVIPMLPEALSNEVCSLKPQVDRLTKCVEFVATRKGEILEAKFYPSVIHSKRRFTYQEVLRLLESGETPKDEIETMLHLANDFAQKVRARRFANGSLDLDFPENKIRLDAEGRVRAIERMENDISHQLIEEFMLLANEAVASHLMAKNIPTVYRVHEPPNELKLQEYREECLSHHVECGNLMNRKEIQKLLALLNELPIGSALKIGFLRSLMRARYDVEPLGHYGLAKEKYAHFTSPIRRYADLIVHRSLFEKVPLSGRDLREVADHISLTERNSDDAERASKEVKLFAHFQAQIDSGNYERYAGLVIDVRNFGFFVDLPDVGISGLVSLSSMDDDYYEFDTLRSQLIGRRTGNLIQLGNRMWVRVAKIDRYKKQIDFAPVAQRPSALPAGRRPEGSAEPRRRFRDQPAARGSEGSAEPRRKFRDQPARHGSEGSAGPRRRFRDQPAARGPEGSSGPRRKFRDQPARPGPEGSGDPRRRFRDQPSARGPEGSAGPRRKFRDQPAGRGSEGSAEPRRKFRDRPARPGPEGSGEPRRKFRDQPAGRGPEGSAGPRRRFRDQPAARGPESSAGPRRKFRDQPGPDRRTRSNSFEDRQGQRAGKGRSFQERSSDQNRQRSEQERRGPTDRSRSPRGQSQEESFRSSGANPTFGRPRSSPRPNEAGKPNRGPSGQRSRGGGGFGKAKNESGFKSSSGGKGRLRSSHN
jgi:ribonuclease R